MIHEIYPHKFDPVYETKAPMPNDTILYYNEDDILLYKEGDLLRFPLLHELTGNKDNKEVTGKFTYLFSIDEIQYFLLQDTEIMNSSNFVFEKITIFRTLEPSYMAFAGVTGSQIDRWYKTRKFCGKCGSPTEHLSTERAFSCTSCKHVEYHKIPSAVIVAITNGDRLLLARNKYSTYKHFALIAGYVEIGESFEETVRREVKEEVGLTVKNIRYYKSQPWSFSDTIMVGFVADLDGEDKFVLQESELSEAAWFHRNEIPEQPSNISIGQEMIECFRNHKF